MKDRVILHCDMNGFFASVECSIRKLNPLTTPLVVCDKTRGDGALILAATPYLKALGVPNRCRLFEIPKIENLYPFTPFNLLIDLSILAAQWAQPRFFNLNTFFITTPLSFAMHVLTGRGTMLPCYRNEYPPDGR